MIEPCPLDCYDYEFRGLHHGTITAHLGHPSVDDYAKDSGEELFTKMHCVLRSKSYRNASWAKVPRRHL